MKPNNPYTNKARCYAKYRWDYAPQAVQAACDAAGITAGSVAADIGAGTGILTRQLTALARVLAVEPDFEMARLIEQPAANSPACRVILARAEATALPDRSVDLITAAHAVHWFDPQPARREFMRIGKPGGWLALFRNYETDSALAAAGGEIFTAENGVNVDLMHSQPKTAPPSFYFGGPFETLRFPFTFEQDWQAFIGAQCSASFTPDEDHPLYPRFETAARSVFDRFSEDGRRRVQGITELMIGRIQ